MFSRHCERPGNRRIVTAQWEGECVVLERGWSYRRAGSRAIRAIELTTIEDARPQPQLSRFDAGEGIVTSGTTRILERNATQAILQHHRMSLKPTWEATA